MQEKKSKEKFFNFPIELLKGFLSDTEKSLDDILHYSVYVHSLRLEDIGDESAAIRCAANFFGLQLKDNVASYYRGVELFEGLPERGPKAGISVSVWRDFYFNQKSHFEKVCLVGHLAIKSILGPKSYCKTNNLFWLSRMDGNRRSVTDSSVLSADIQKMGNNYQMRKLKNELCSKWGFVTYSRYTRGFYVSYSMNLDALVLEAEKRRPSNIRKMNKRKVDVAVQKAQAKIFDQPFPLLRKVN